MKTRWTLSGVLCLVFAGSSLALAGETASSSTKTPAAKSTSQTAHMQSSTSGGGEKQSTHKSSTSQGHMSKTEVMDIQKALAASGDYKGEVDGKFGPQTREALRAYQKSNSLKVTGKADAETLSHLGVQHSQAGMSKGSPQASNMKSGTPSAETAAATAKQPSPTPK